MASFRGASAESVAALTQELEAAVFTPERAAAAAGDLFRVAAALRSEGSLRRFLTDASVPTPAKTGLVRDLFGGRIDEAAHQVLASAAGRRWIATRDLADALEQLSVVAWVLSARGEERRLADELFAVQHAVKENGELRDALSDASRPLEDRVGLLASLLEGRAHPASLALAQQSLSGSYRTVGVALEDYQRIASEVHGKNVATVRVARPLNENEERRLADALSRQYGRPVHLNTVVDPRVIGGIRVEIGDDVIDGTVVSRLDDARRRIAG